jgi:hypothetical protein
VSVEHPRTTITGLWDNDEDRSAVWVLRVARSGEPSHGTCQHGRHGIGGGSRLQRATLERRPDAFDDRWLEGQYPAIQPGRGLDCPIPGRRATLMWSDYEPREERS